jgi:hypothetical protein
VPAIVVDMKQYPVVMQLFNGEQTHEEMDYFVQETKKMIERRQMYVSVTWILKYSFNEEYRKRTAELMREMDPLVRKYNVCSVMITRSSGFRFVLGAVFLLKPLPVPYKVCGTWAEAETFLRAESKKRGLVLPARIEPLVADG